MTSEALARLDDDLLRRQARHVVTENARVLRVARALSSGADLRTIGPDLSASHASMRDDFEITVPQVDTAVEAALSAGAHGARAYAAARLPRPLGVRRLPRRRGPAPALTACTAGRSPLALRSCPGLPNGPGGRQMPMRTVSEDFLGKGCAKGGSWFSLQQVKRRQRNGPRLNRRS